eukprot:Nk52_evm18s1178 gene=Nk52_evmTU18s1178
MNDTSSGLPPTGAGEGEGLSLGELPAQTRLMIFLMELSNYAFVVTALGIIAGGAHLGLMSVVGYYQEQARLNNANSDEDGGEEERDSGDEETSKSAHFALSSNQALLFPVIASVMLLLLYFLLDSMWTVFFLSQIFVSIYTSTLLWQPLCTALLNKIYTSSSFVSCRCSLLPCTPGELCGICVALFVVYRWLFTGHWLWNNLLAVGSCVFLLSNTSIPNVRIAMMVLLGLLVYDVFWVFFSKYIFTENVMVHVASSQGANPAKAIAEKMNIPGAGSVVPKLGYPGTIVYPLCNIGYNLQGTNILGLGDILLPGYFLALLYRFCEYSEQTGHQRGGVGIGGRSVLGRVWSLMRQGKYYILTSAVKGYVAGLGLAFLSTSVFLAAQPALLYIVPCMLLSVVYSAKQGGDFARMMAYEDNMFEKVYMPVSLERV